MGVGKKFSERQKCISWYLSNFHYNKYYNGKNNKRTIGIKTHGSLLHLLLDNSDKYMYATIRNIDLKINKLV